MIKHSCVYKYFKIFFLRIGFFFASLATLMPFTTFIYSLFMQYGGINGQADCSKSCNK